VDAERVIRLLVLDFFVDDLRVVARAEVRLFVCRVMMIRLNPLPKR
jgi:hypothetical protein